MIIKLFTNSSESIKVDKSLTALASLICTIKDETSVLNPIVLVSTKTFSELSNCNYAQIDDPAFGSRYYFVGDPVTVTKGLTELPLHVDVLSTWKTAIRDTEAVIARNENKFNTYLPDSAIQAQQNSIIVTRKFPVSLDQDNYILVLAGGSNTE